jgi:hypothetical protein
LEKVAEELVYLQEWVLKVHKEILGLKELQVFVE